ncbi:MAG TPA: FAD-dependent oxidoreductase [Tepidisphaeraceae bacterium]|jgi:tryptophan halogenase|nr:FAD-dependent oxidoreductase [Tepidisphaeraceae bacterium]
MIKKIIVLGGGSAGFIAALTLKSKIPALDVLVIRSKDIGIIGVGEGSTYALTSFLHEYLRVNEKKFFSIARPTFKLGLRFIWGPRPHFNYSFGPSVDQRLDPALPHAAGFYAEEDMECIDPISAMMTYDRVFERTVAGPRIHRSLAYHFENEKFVRYLEGYATGVGVRVLDDTVGEVRQDENGISALVLKSGRIESAELYVDCSGFGSLLLGKALNEPLIGYDRSLFCDRAVVGGWERADEVIKPYTTCETMNSGWCWQIELEQRINRGYVYSSNFISDDEAEKEFRSANPKVGPTRVVRFISGRYQRNWVKNVIALGNAAGFVEPLEATALSIMALQTRDLTQTLIESDLCPRPSQIACNNRAHAWKWEGIRKFLAVHYKFNTRLETPFWSACRNDTDLAGAEEVVEYYRENGPAPYWGPTLLDLNDHNGFGGYAALLLGQKVPFHRSRQPTDAERKIWESRKKINAETAVRSMTVKEALDVVHSNRWEWR